MAGQPRRGKSRSLTVFLLSKKGAAPRDFLKPEKQVEPYEIPVIPEAPWALYVETRLPQPPKWADFFEDYVEPRLLGKVNSSSAALMVPTAGRWFAVTFGQGRYLLREDAVVEGFGLRVALNAVGEESLRSIDRERFDAVASHARQQASRDAPAYEFDLDVDRDLMRAVTGTPDDEAVGKRFTGRDSLGITINATLDDVETLLQSLYKLYRSDAYKEKFPWVDHIREVRGVRQKEELDNRLLAALREEDLSGTWLAPPQILEWGDVRYFTYSRSSLADEFPDIHWKKYLEKVVPAMLTTARLKNRRIFCFGEDFNLIASWPVYNCIYAEIETVKGAFFLSGGSWYRVESDFVGQVNASFAAAPRADGILPIYEDDSETEYNKRVAEQSGGRLALMDQAWIYRGGGRSKLEFCDLFSDSKDIICVKRYSGSREMSHLFTQGLVAAEEFLLDSQFRISVNEKLSDTHKLTDPRSHIVPRHYRVIFAIISRSDGPLTLPFFSKIALRQALTRLQGFGYTVAVAKVDVSEKISKFRRCKSRGKKRL